MKQYTTLFCLNTALWITGCAVARPTARQHTGSNDDVIERVSALIHQPESNELEQYLPSLSAIAASEPGTAASLRARNLLAQSLARLHRYAEALQEADSALALPQVKSDDRLHEAWRRDAAQFSVKLAEMSRADTDLDTAQRRIDTYLADVLPLQAGGPLRMGAPSGFVSVIATKRAELLCELGRFNDARIAGEKSVSTIEQSLLPAALVPERDLHYARIVLAGACIGANRLPEAFKQLSLLEATEWDPGLRTLNALYHSRNADPMVRARFALEASENAVGTRRTVQWLSVIIECADFWVTSPEMAARALPLLREACSPEWADLRAKLDASARSQAMKHELDMNTYERESQTFALQHKLVLALATAGHQAESDDVRTALRTRYADSPDALKRVGWLP